MGQAGSSNSSTSPLANCLNTVCNGRSDCVAYPDNLLYQINWVTVYNLDIPITPIAVTRPDTADDVSGFVKCAASNNVKVQAKSGGHSYAYVPYSLITGLLLHKFFLLTTSAEILVRY